MQGTYGYFDQGDGVVLVKRVGYNQGHVYYSGELVNLKGAHLMTVPKKYLAARRAPSVLWKPNANPDVKNAIEVEMIDLQGAEAELGAPSLLELSAFAAPAVMLIVGVVLLVRSR